MLAKDGNDTKMILSSGLMIVTFLFKISSAPFHLVGPDLYDGVPTNITTWMIHIPKLGVLLLLIQIYHLLQPAELLFIFSGICSILVGSIGLGAQIRIKRFLAYSSISHLGFILLTLASLQFDSTVYYLVIYIFTSLTIFTILLALGHTQGREIKFITQLSGLFHTNLPLALALSMAFFSLAGVPFTSGFFAKLMALQAFISQGWYWIAIIGILCSVISAAYYLYIIKVSHFDLPLLNYQSTLPSSVTYLISILSIFNLFLMFFPAQFLILSSLLLF